jgi:hypothetical protein
MKRYGPQFFLFLLVLAAAITLACGSSPGRMLESVTLSPTQADAQNFPGGLVQFTATGTYTKPPSPVMPLPASWGACDASGNSTTQVSVSATGLAQCATGASGIYEVWAFDEILGKVPCYGPTVCGRSCGLVTGTALLTCP